MTIIVTGNGLGLFNTSANLVGSSGNPLVGRAGQSDGVYVNGTTGNLVIRSQDEFLTSVGLDTNIVRTYNSLGQFNDDNGDNWRLNVGSLINFPAAPDTPGSTITKRFGDGAEVIYTYDADLERYVSSAGDGAADTIELNDSNSNPWIWVDGTTRVMERYDGAGRLLSVSNPDRAFNGGFFTSTTTYSYTGNLLTEIKDASGQHFYFQYSGNNLIEIRTVRTDVDPPAVQTLVRYGYDTSNRLKTVTIDLSPEDNVITDGKTFVTSYTYDGTSKRVASITQGDGTSISFTYDTQGRVQTYTDGAGQVTSLTYSEGTQTASASAALNTGALTAPAPSWAGAALRETLNTAGAFAPQFKFDQNGNGLSMWVQGADLYVSTYTKSTDSWNAPTTIDGGLTGSPSASYPPHLSISANGNALVTWLHQVGTQTNVYARRRINGVWDAAPVLLESSIQNAVTPVGAVNDGGRALVVFMQSDGTRYNVFANVHNGTSWQATPVSLDDKTSANNNDPLSGYPSAAIDPNGNATVVWLQMNPWSGETAPSAQFMRYTAATNSWSNPNGVIIEGAASAVSDVQMLLDQNGNGVAVWTQGSSIFAKTYNASIGTGSWSAPVTLSTQASGRTHVSMSANGNVLVTWSNVFTVRARRYVAGSWMSEETLATAGSAANPRGSINNAGQAAVAFLQTVNVDTNGDGILESVNNIYVRRTNGGAAWDGAVLIETSANSIPSANSMSVAIDAQGNTQALWLQKSGAETMESVYSNRFSVIPTGPSYYTVTATDMAAANPPGPWGAIAQKLYGTSQAGNALATAMGNPALSTGLTLSGFPASVSYTTNVVTSRRLDIEDPLHRVTTYVSDTQGKLTQVLSPAVEGVRFTSSYEYDAKGNVITVTDGNGASVHSSFDAFDNLILKRDSLGNTVTYTYNAANQLTGETRYTIPDNDGSGPNQPSGALTTRLVYDAEQHLRFSVSAEGRVIEHRYDIPGNRTATIRYTGSVYNVSSLTPGDTLTESQLSTWIATRDLTKTERTDYTYDFRGNLSTSTVYATVNASGAGVADGTQSKTQYLYDQRGLLLQTIDARGAAASPNASTTGIAYARTFMYDGVLRLTQEWIGTGAAQSQRTIFTTYDDAGNKVMTTSNGALTTTHVFDQRGWLVGSAQSAAVGGQPLGSTSYTYNPNGQLVMTRELPIDNKTYFVYDPAGRMVATIDATGAMVESVYDNAGNVVKQIAYANRLASDQLASVVDLGTNPPTYAVLATLRPLADGTYDRTTRNIFDAANRLVMTISAHDTDTTKGYVTQNFYDGAGRLTDVVAYAKEITVTGLAAVPTPAQVSALITIVPAGDRHVRSFYDNEGKLIARLDGEGFLCEYQYNGAGELIHDVCYDNPTAVALRDAGTLADLKTSAGVDSANDQHNYYFYDAKGQRIASLDAEGYLTESGYDTTGNETSRTRYYNKANVYTGTQTPSQLRPTVHANDAVTLSAYDAFNRLISLTTNPSGTVTHYTYDLMGNLVKTERAWNTSEVRTAQARYDATGRVLQELTAEGSAAIANRMGWLPAPTQAEIDALWAQYSVTHAYDENGRRLSSTDQYGNKTFFYYDSDNRVTHTINALGEVRETRYNAFGQVRETRRYSNRIATAGLSGGAMTQTLRDAIDANVSLDKDARTQTDYGLRGAVKNAIEYTTPTKSFTTQFAYNAFGEVANRYTPIVVGGSTLNGSNKYTYDRRGLLIQTIEDDDIGPFVGIKRTTATVYDAFGRAIETTDGLGTKRTATYDRLGRTVTATDPTGTRSTTYDAFSRTVTYKDAFNNATTTTYDDANRTFTLTTPEGITTKTTVNRHGETVKIIDGRGVTTVFEYDLNGKLVKEIDAQNSEYRVTYSQYDRASRLIKATDARGEQTLYTYDAANRLLTRTVDVPTWAFDTEALSLKTSYAYDGVGRTLSVTDPRGIVTQTTYDAKGEVIEVAVDPGSQNLRTSYTYDAQGRTLTVTEGAGTPEARTIQYRYDRLGRRIETRIDPTGLNLVTQYEFDKNGNVTGVTDANGKVTRHYYDGSNREIYTLSPLNELTAQGYDAEGRVTSVIRYATPLTGGGFPTSNPSQSDIETRLLQIADSSRDQLSLAVFDKDGRRIYSINSLGEVTQFFFDANGNVVKTIAYAKRITLPQTIDVGSIKAAIEAENPPADTTLSHRVMTYVFDDLNRLRFSVNSLGEVQRRDYDKNGNLVRTVDYAQPIATVSPTTLYAMFSATNAIRDDANDGAHSYVYDGANRLVYTLTKMAAGPFAYAAEVAENVFDASGNIVRTIRYAKRIPYPSWWDSYIVLGQVRDALDRADPLNQTDYRVFDSANRLVYSFNAQGEVTQHVQDAVGNTVRTIRFADRITIPSEVNDTTVGDALIEARNKPGATPQADQMQMAVFDAARRLIYGVTAMGEASENLYDANGNLVRRVQYLNPIEAPSELTASALQTAINAKNPEAEAASNRVTTNYIFDADNRLRYSIDALRYVSETIYDAKGNAIRQVRYDKPITLPATLDAAGNIANLIEPALNRSTRTVFDSENRARYTIDPMGHVRETRYNALGQATESIRYSAIPTTLTQPAPTADQVKTAIELVDDPGQDAHTRFAYDGAGRLTHETDAEGIVTHSEHDALGNRRVVTRAYGTADQSSTQYFYDQANRLVRIEVAGLTTHLLSDTFGNVAARIDVDTVTQERQANGYFFDTANRLIEQTRSLYTDTGEITVSSKTDYDAFGNVKRRTDAAGSPDQRVSTFTYDRDNRLVSTTDPMGGVTAYTYNAVGDRISETNANVIPLTTLEDAAGVPDYYRDFRKRLGVVYTSGAHAGQGKWVGDLTDDDKKLLLARTTISSTYDGNHNLIQVTDTKGVVTRYTYDSAGNKETITEAAGLGVEERLTSYEYDRNNNLTKVTNPLGGVTSYEYNFLGKETKTTDARGRIADSLYDRLGRLTKHYSNTTGSGVLTINTYDNRNNVKTATQLFTNGTDARTTIYGYDALDRQTLVTDGEGFSTIIVYDGFGNQRQVNHGAYLLKPGDSGYDAEKAARAFDLVTTFTYDSLNRLVSMQDGAGDVTTYGFDLVGNRTTVTESAEGTIASSLPRTTTSHYDANNRLTQLDTPVGGRTFYFYDQLGNKIAEETLQSGVAGVASPDNFYYVVQAQDTWERIVEKLYGRAVGTAENAEMAEELRNTPGMPTDLIAGTRLEHLPAQLSFTTYIEIKVPGYYLVPENPHGGDLTWENIALDLYGSSQAVLDHLPQIVERLKQEFGEAIPAVGAHLTAPPLDIEVVTQETIYVPGGFIVVPDGASQGAIWAQIAEGLYGNAAYADALAREMGYRTLTPGERLYAGSPPQGLPAHLTVNDGDPFFQATADTWLGIIQASYRTNPPSTGSRRDGKSDANAAEELRKWALTRGISSPTQNSGHLPLDMLSGFTVEGDLISGGENNVTYFFNGTSTQLTKTVDRNDEALRRSYTEDKHWHFALSAVLKTTDLWPVLSPVDLNSAGMNTWIRTRYEYDARRQLTAQVDPYEVRTENDYDAVGNLTKTRFAATTIEERTKGYEYDLNNRKITDIDAYGKRIAYTYDKVGNRTTVTDSIGKVAHYYYNGLNQLLTVLDPEGFINTFDYDAAGNRTEQRVYMTRYTGAINADNLTPPTATASDSDRVTRFIFNRANQLASKVEADGTKTEIVYNGAGKKKRETHYADTLTPRGLEYTYDLAGRVATFTDVDGTVTSFTYDGANNTLSETITNLSDPNPVRRTKYEYDLNNRRTLETFLVRVGKQDQVLGRIRTIYDLLGNVIAKKTYTSETEGGVESFQYDLNNREVRAFDQYDRAAHLGYDRLGNQISATDRRGYTTDYAFDLNNRLIKEISPEAALYTLPQYDTDGNLIGGGDSVARPTTLTTYDDLGRVAQIIDPNGHKTTRYYDGNSQLAAELKADNTLCEYFYNAAGELIEAREYMTRLPVSAHKPNLAALDNNRPTPPAGEVRVTNFEYDHMGRQTRITLPAIAVTTLSNPDGNTPSTSQVTKRPTEEKVYDAFGDEVETRDRAANRTFSYYDVNHEKRAAVDALGYLVEWDYDQQGNQTEQRVYTQPLDVSLLRADTRPIPPTSGAVHVINRVYDAASRLLKEIAPEIEVFNAKTQQSSGVRPTTVYTYDLAGRQLTKTLVGAGGSEDVIEYSVYDDANHLSLLIDGEHVLHVYTYDANGNMTSRTRYYGTVPTEIDITPDVSFPYLRANLVAGEQIEDPIFPNDPAPILDQTTRFEYDGLNRMSLETDVMDPLDSHDDLSTRSKYDAVGNRSYFEQIGRASENEAHLTQSAYDAMGRVTQTVTPDGSTTFFEYDAAGNVTRAYLGGTQRNLATEASAIEATAVGSATNLFSTIKIGWQVAVGTQQSYVVYDTQSHPSAEGISAAYGKQTQPVVTASAGQVSTTLDPQSTSTRLYFRVVTQDAAGNKIYSAERSLLVPLQLSALNVDADKRAITVRFAAPVILPRLFYGTPGNINSPPIDFTSQGDGSYKATLPASVDLNTTAYLVRWQDVEGLNTFSTSEATFALVQSLDRAAMTSVLTPSAVSDGTTTRFTVEIASSLSASTLDALRVTQLKAEWRKQGAPMGYAPTLSTPPETAGAQSSFILTLGTAAPLDAGNYEIVLSGLHADGTSVVLDTFAYTAGANTTRQSVSWRTPPAGSAQLVIVDGEVRTSIREAERLLIDTPALGANASSTYLVLYGDRFAQTHTTTVTSSNTGGGTTNLAVTAILTSAEIANMGTGGLHLAYRSAASGSSFTNDAPVLATTPVGTYGQTLTLDAGQYDLKLYYLDAQNREVILEWSRIDTAQATTSFVPSQSLIVLGRESGAIAKDAGGVLSITPNAYSGAVDVLPLLGSPVALTLKPTAGSTFVGSTTDGRTSGYFTENVYNALNYRTLTNEKDGLYRSFGVNAAGAIVETKLYGDIKPGEAGDNTAPITTFTEVDARGRAIAEFGPALDAFNPTNGSITKQRPITRYTYDVFDRMTSKTLPRDATWETTPSTWTYEYNALGSLIKETNPLQGITLTRVDQFGHVTAVTTPKGVATPDIAFDYTSFKFYDHAGNLIEERDSEGNRKGYRYDLFKRKIAETDGRGMLTSGDAFTDNDYTTRYRYDNHDRLIQIVGAQGWHLGHDDSALYKEARLQMAGFSAGTFFTTTTDIIRDATGKIIGQVVRAKRADELNDDEKRALQALYTTQYRYDGHANRILTKENPGEWVENYPGLGTTYDKLNRVIQTHSTFEGQSVDNKTIYDAYGNTIAEIDAEGREKHFIYGSFGRLQQAIDEDGNTIIYEYDGFGRLSEEYNAAGTWDEQQVTKRQVKHIKRTYDDAGRLTKIEDLKTNVTTTYDYTLSGQRLIESIQAPRTGRRLRYSYDAMGRMTAMVDEASSWPPTTQHNLHLLYDADGNRVQAYTDTGYDPFGENTANNPNYRYIHHVYTFDQAGRLLKEVDRKTDADGTEHDDKVMLAYTYDAADNQASYTDEKGLTWNYRYADGTAGFDAANRVNYASAESTVTDVTGIIKPATLRRRWAYNHRGDVVSYVDETGSKKKTTDTELTWTGTVTSSEYPFAGLGANLPSVVTTSSLGGITSSTQALAAVGDKRTTTRYDLSGRTVTVVSQEVTGMTSLPRPNIPPSPVIQSFTLHYSYWGDGRERGVIIPGAVHGTSTTTYDGNKQKKRVVLGQGSDMPRVELMDFVNDNEGHIIVRTHDDGRSDTREKTDYYYANGNPLGEVAWQTNHSYVPTSLKKVALDSAGYSVIANGPSPGINQSYSVRAGDTLQSIASMFYGNPSLWFVIADANGLDATTPLTERTSLIIPSTLRTGEPVGSSSHALYNPGEIVKTTLPNLIVPPPPGLDACEQFVSIVIIVVIAAVAAFATAGIGGAIVGAFASTATSSVLGTLAAAGVYAAVGTAVGFAASVLQQYTFMMMGYQDDINWEDAGKESVLGAISGAAQGVGKVALLAAKAGKLTSVGSFFAKVAVGALQGTEAAIAQYLYKGKITSYVGIAALTFEGINATGVDVAMAQGETKIASIWKDIELGRRYLTPWTQLAEIYIREEIDKNDRSIPESKKTKHKPSDWASAIANTTERLLTPESMLGLFGGNKQGMKNLSPFTTRVVNTSMRVGVNMLVAADYFRNDEHDPKLTPAETRAQFFASSSLLRAGREVGNFLGGLATDGLESFVSRPKPSPAPDEDPWGLDYVPPANWPNTASDPNDPFDLWFSTQSGSEAELASQMRDWRPAVRYNDGRGNELYSASAMSAWSPNIGYNLNGNSLYSGSGLSNWQPRGMVNNQFSLSPAFADDLNYFYGQKSLLLANGPLDSKESVQGLVNEWVAESRNTLTMSRWHPPMLYPEKASASDVTGFVMPSEEDIALERYKKLAPDLYRAEVNAARTRQFQLQHPDFIDNAWNAVARRWDEEVNGPWSPITMTRKAWDMSPEERWKDRGDGSFTSIVSFYGLDPISLSKDWEIARDAFSSKQMAHKVMRSLMINGTYGSDMLNGTFQYDAFDVGGRWVSATDTFGPSFNKWDGSRSMERGRVLVGSAALMARGIIETWDIMKWGQGVGPFHHPMNDDYGDFVGMSEDVRGAGSVTGASSYRQVWANVSRDMIPLLAINMGSEHAGILLEGPGREAMSSTKKTLFKWGTEFALTNSARFMVRQLSSDGTPDGEKPFANGAWPTLGQSFVTLGIGYGMTDHDFAHNVFGIGDGDRRMPWQYKSLAWGVGRFFGAHAGEWLLERHPQYDYLQYQDPNKK